MCRTGTRPCSAPTCCTCGGAALHDVPQEPGNLRRRDSTNDLLAKAQAAPQACLNYMLGYHNAACIIAGGKASVIPRDIKVDNMLGRFSLDSKIVYSQFVARWEVCTQHGVNGGQPIVSVCPLVMHACHNILPHLISFPFRGVNSFH